MSERRYSDLELTRRLLDQARPYWPHLAGIFGLGLLATPLALLTPLPLKIVVDSVVGDHPLPGWLRAGLPLDEPASATTALVVAVVLVVAIAILYGLQSLGSAYLNAYTGEKLVLEFRARLFHHIQRFSLLFHDVKGTHDTTYRILYDAPSIQWIAIHGIPPFVTAMIMLVAMIVVTAGIDLQLALVALAISPPLLFLTLITRPRLRSRWKEAKQLESSAVSVVQEVLGAVRVVKAFGQEEREHDRFVGHAEEGVDARIRAMVSEQVFSFATGIVVAIGTALVLFLGARHVLAGTLTLGNLVLVMAYLAQLYAPLKTMGFKVTTIQNSLAGAERAFELLDREPDVTERPDASPIDRARGDVAFERVSFAYEEGVPVLRDISFEVAAGTLVGIAGHTGAGKTTLVSLLTRFYDPTSGRILLDGRDVRDVRVADLRDQFAIVLQEPVLFSTSVAENIAYARPGASRADVEAAARAANAHDFITATSDGYETLVGERGMRLSGGERQRISLARAFLKDAPLLILDEPTSSVDTETEALIMESMERLMEGRTTFMIAHRRSTMKNCDRLLMIQEGRVIAYTSRAEALGESLL